MQEFLTRETPSKVLACTGAALVSMAFLFAVSAGNASFQGSEYILPNPFAPENVVSAIDQAAASYSNALSSFSQPARQAVGVHLAQVEWILAEIVGPSAQNQERAWPQVAGATTEGSFDSAVGYGEFTAGDSFEPVSMDTIYSVLIGE